ncbi:MAG: hypothetical protein R6V58_17115 [Planctomycetota bacterium]
MRPISLVFTAAIALASTAYAGDAAPFDLDELPANEWTRLPAQEDLRGYEYGQPAYVPSRGQILHWGTVRRIYRVPNQFANDVRAFNAETGRWESDYPSDKNAKAAAASGRPGMSSHVNSLIYDSKRKRLMTPNWTYDPAARTWEPLKTKTSMHGTSRDGPPYFGGVGMCYDPVNDEVVMFPHYGGPKSELNIERMDVDGRVANHHGTLRLDFSDLTWRRVGGTFGADGVQAQRKAVLNVLARASDALDAVYVARRRGTVSDPHAKALQKAAGGTDKLTSAEEANAERIRELATSAKSALQKAAQAAKAGNADNALAAGRDALWALDDLLDGPLRVEPPARAATPMVYHPGKKAIVMFGGYSGRVRVDLHPPHHLGGHPGRLNDTWLYDCRTREWKPLELTRRPPENVWPKLFYDPASEQIVLVQWTEANRRTKVPARFWLWTLDLEKGRWSKRMEVEWPGPLTVRRCYASRTPLWNVAFDPKHKLLVMAQNLRTGKVVTQHTWVMKLDVASLPSSPAPTWEPEPPEKPQTVPPNDPTWIATLKALPANTWKGAGVHRLRRDWGNIGQDPARGWIAFFGGGHSTYQVNDVALYQPGANEWSFAAGDHNDFIPPTGWGGAYVGFRGGMWAHHQRNQYQLIDGRLYCKVGGGGLRKRGTGRAFARGRAWFYDVDRGGLWRMKPAEMDIADGAKELRYPSSYGAPHMADPAGKLVSFNIMVGRKYGRTVRKVNFSSYDIYENKLTVRTVPKPWPSRVGESRPWCLLPDRGKIFYFQWHRPRKKDVEPDPHCWIYDIEANRFTDLKAKNIPAGRCEIVVYLDGHDAIFATVHGKQWVYSFERNAWAPLPYKGDKTYLAGPYGQLAYVKKYGVLVNVPGNLAVMRPDLSEVKWEE